MAGASTAQAALSAQSSAAADPVEVRFRGRDLRLGIEQGVSVVDRTFGGAIARQLRVVDGLREVVIDEHTGDREGQARAGQQSNATNVHGERRGDFLEC